jgi:hypothetical protein
MTPPEYKNHSSSVHYVNGVAMLNVPQYNHYSKDNKNQLGEN